MTTGNNKENPYGDYVPGQYSSGASAQGQQDAAPSSSSYGQGAAGQAPQTNPYASENTPGYNGSQQGYGDYSQQANSASSQPNYGQADYSQQPASYPSYGYDAYSQQVTSAPKGLAITSLILGILSFLGGWVILGGILGIVGLVLGIVALRKTKTGGGGKGLAITGIVFSSLGILISLAMLVFFGWIFSAFGECMAYAENEVLMEQCINQQVGLDATESNSNV
ncbi:DUF4190 domain-containing protein [Rothia nasimurium]|uniref:DUF4190 domain-containing protein n=1 Tax=Rothia nasimurium TaxID=85336 RepID=A0A4Y9F607_9MICC|nr:DUF4190 domain-containing protein [Rothia nasimurium]MBF0807888.1 DUF4190 domain-containing protein [Rothia nasimurium]TFU22892.1 DUF4190 domain-containing protein [Rothia nasimurium]